MTLTKTIRRREQRKRAKQRRAHAPSNTLVTLDWLREDFFRHLEQQLAVTRAIVNRKY